MIINYRWFGFNFMTVNHSLELVIIRGDLIGLEYGIKIITLFNYLLKIK